MAVEPLVFKWIGKRHLWWFQIEKQSLDLHGLYKNNWFTPYIIIIMLCHLNPLKPEFTIVIFIHYKPRIAVAILDL